MSATSCCSAPARRCQPAPDGRPLGFANTFYPGTSRAREAIVVPLGSGESRTDLDLSVRLTPTVTVAGVLTGPDGPMKHMTLSLVPPGTDLDDFERRRRRDRHYRQRGRIRISRDHAG